MNSDFFSACGPNETGLKLENLPIQANLINYIDLLLEYDSTEFLIICPKLGIQKLSKNKIDAKYLLLQIFHEFNILETDLKEKIQFLFQLPCQKLQIVCLHNQPAPSLTKLESLKKIPSLYNYDTRYSLLGFLPLVNGLQTTDGYQYQLFEHQEATFYSNLEEYLQSCEIHVLNKNNKMEGNSIDNIFTRTCQVDRDRKFWKREHIYELLFDVDNFENDIHLHEKFFHDLKKTGDYCLIDDLNQRDYDLEFVRFQLFKQA